MLSYIRIHRRMILIVLLLVLLFVDFLYFTRDNKYIGTYQTNAWYGKQTVIVLNKDHTMVGPDRKGTWEYKDNKIYIHVYINYVGLNDKITDEEVDIVPGGIMFHGGFFQKIG